MAVQLDSDWKALSEQELEQLKEEVRISRELRSKSNNSNRLPYLPAFNGETGISFHHYLSAIKSVEATNSDITIVQAIRKTATGAAAKVLDGLDYSTNKSEIIQELQHNFAPVSDKSAAWQNFYAASQKPKESLVEWRTRVLMLYKETSTTPIDDAAIKNKLYVGLTSQRLKDLVAWKFEDPNCTEAELFNLLRKMSERAKDGTMSSIQCDDRTKELEKKVQELTALVASLSPTDKQNDRKDNSRRDGGDRQKQSPGQKSPYNSNERHNHNRQQIQDRHRSPPRRYNRSPPRRQQSPSRGRNYSPRRRHYSPHSRRDYSPRRNNYSQQWTSYSSQTQDRDDRRYHERHDSRAQPGTEQRRASPQRYYRNYSPQRQYNRDSQRGTSNATPHYKREDNFKMSEKN